MSTLGELNAIAKSFEVFKAGAVPEFEPKPLPRSTGFGCRKCDGVEQNNSILRPDPRNYKCKSKHGGTNITEIHNHSVPLYEAFTAGLYPVKITGTAPFLSPLALLKPVPRTE